MISHIRHATTSQFGGGGRGGGQQSTKKNVNDRTSTLQSTIQGIIRSKHSGGFGRQGLYAIGGAPCHFDGRGHLEGTCLAKNEGLLETKKQRRKRKRNGGGGGGSTKKRKKSKMDAGDSEDDGFSGDDSEEEDEEEIKVWKPASSINSRGDADDVGVGKSTATTKTKKRKSENDNPRDKMLTDDTPNDLDPDLKSLNRDGVDWSKSSKYGKKSNANFQSWLTAVGDKLNRKQMDQEDCMFTFI